MTTLEIKSMLLIIKLRFEAHAYHSKLFNYYSVLNEIVEEYEDDFTVKYEGSIVEVPNYNKGSGDTKAVITSITGDTTYPHNSQLYYNAFELNNIFDRRCYHYSRVTF